MKKLSEVIMKDSIIDLILLTFFMGCIILAFIFSFNAISF